MLKFFCWKNVSGFSSAKATHIFSAKNIRILYIESAKTVNKMTLNKLVKLTLFWTTGTWMQAANAQWFYTKSITHKQSFQIPKAVRVLKQSFQNTKTFQV